MKTKKNDIKNINQWMIIGIGIIVFILFIFLLTRIRISTSDNKSIKYLFDENKLIIIEKNNLYGLINTNGKEIVKPEYDYVIDDYGKYFILEKDNKYYMVDGKGKIRLESETAITYNKEKDLYTADYKLYNSNLNQISPNNVGVTHSGSGYYRFISTDGETAGVMTSTGRITYKQKINKGQSFYVYVGEIDENLKEVYCAISPDNSSYAIINCNTGKVIEKYTSESIVSLGNNIFRIGRGGVLGTETVYVSNDKYAISIKKDAVLRYYPTGYVEYEEEGTKKYLDVRTNKVSEEQPEKLYETKSQAEWEIETGYNKISCDRKYGIINNEKVLIPCEYDQITFIPYKAYSYLKSIGKNLVFGKKGKKTYLININNRKTVHTFNTDKTINTATASPFIYYHNDENKILVYNLANDKEIVLDADKIEAFGNYFKAYKDKKITYYNRNMKKIYESDLNK